MSTARWIALFVCALVGAVAPEVDAQTGPRTIKPEDKARIVPLVRPLFPGEKKVDLVQREKIEPMKGLSMEVRGAPVPEDQVPVMDTFVGDLSIRYGVDDPKFMMTLSPSLLQSQSWNRNELLKVSVENLTRIYQGSLKVQRGKPGIAMLTGGGELESSWLLVKEFWEQEAKSAKGALVAAVPARDVLIFIDAAVPDRVSELRQLVNKVYADAGRTAVSKLLYVWKAGAWEIYE